METKNEQVVEDEFGTDADPLPKEEAVDSELATEALEEVSEEPAGKAEDTVPLSKYMGEKNARRDAELQTAKLEGQLSERVKIADKPVEPEKSPIQSMMIEQEVDREEDLELTAGEALLLGRKETAFDAKQSAKQVAVEKEQTLQGELKDMYKTEAALDRGDGLDYDTIIEMGDALLTPGERLDFGNSKTPYALGYKLCIRAILERGDEATKKTLQDRLTRKTEKVVDGDPPPPKEKVTADETSDEQIVNPRLAALADGIFKS